MEARTFLYQEAFFCPSAIFALNSSVSNRRRSVSGRSKVIEPGSFQPASFSRFSDDLGNSVCSSAWAFLHLGRKSLKDGREFIGTNSDNREIHLCHKSFSPPPKFI